MKTLLQNARLVLLDEIIPDGCVLIENGVIAAFNPSDTNSDQSIDLHGQYLLPGLIDIHSDVLEKEVEPRSGVLFPADAAVEMADRRCASTGITTQFHGIAFGGAKQGARSNELVSELAKTIKDKTNSLIDNRILLRYEIASPDSFQPLMECMQSRYCDLISLMDHSSNTAAYKDIEAYLIKHKLIEWSGEIPDYILDEPVRLQALERVQTICRTAKKMGIPIGSHDDKTLMRLETMEYFGMSISEFPVVEEVAHKATEMGIFCVMGGPNAVRGGSHLNWLCASEAAQKGIVQCLCSDYHPAILLTALFTLANKNILPLPNAVKLGSYNPAKAAQLDDRGMIAVGKRADLISVMMIDDLPKVTHTWVKGMEVFRSV